ncbi:MAG: OmpA family protein [Saprospiraceae bacterium]
MQRLLLALSIVFLLKTAFSQSLQVKVEKLPALVNSPYDEFSPVVSIDGKEIYFTRVGDPNFNRQLIIDEVDVSQSNSRTNYQQILGSVYSQIAGRSILDPVKSSFNQDIFIASAADGKEFTKVKQPPAPLNNALPNSLCAITGEPNTFVIMNQFDPKGGMQAGFSTITRQADGSWTNPQPLQIDDYYTKSESVNLTMAADGSVLILSLQRADSYGMNDLYVSFRQTDGTFSIPENLGSTVNSAFRETTPALSEDKYTLYFSSNRAGSGHNDIYMIKRRDESWTNWSRPRRYKMPINSLSDDSQPYFNEMTGYLYFTSRRDGNSDIYRVQLATPRRPEVGIKGRIIDAVTGELLENKVFYGDKTAKYWERQQVAYKGEFKIYVPKGKNYQVRVERAGYLGSTMEFFFEENRYYVDNQEVNIYLTPISVGAKIHTAPIYFAQSSADLMESAFLELERIVDILLKNETIKMEIGGHTDNQGKPQSLQQLSEERARKVKAFLVKKGISTNRLTTIGYGATQPLTENATEMQREQNRRVEFKITEN